MNNKTHNFSSDKRPPTSMVISDSYNRSQMVYQWRNGNSYRGLDAQTVGNEFERIRAEHDGELYTKDIVENAEDESSPLHNGFTWDDSVAGYNWRLHEARQIVRFLYTVTDNGKTVPEYINVRKSIVEVSDEGDDEEGDETHLRYYQSRRVLPQNPDEYEFALHAAKQRLESARRELSDLHSIAQKPKQIHIAKAQQRVAQAQQALASAA